MPDLTVDIMAMGPTFVPGEISFETMTAFWTRGKDEGGAWKDDTYLTPVGAVSIYGAMDGESPMDACTRLGRETWGAAKGYKGQLTDYSGATITATKLDSDFLTNCPRPGGPKCPEGTKEAGTCSDAVEIRGGTLAGAEQFVRETTNENAAMNFAHEFCCLDVAVANRRNLLFGSRPGRSWTATTCRSTTAKPQPNARRHAPHVRVGELRGEGRGGGPLIRRGAPLPSPPPARRRQAPARALRPSPFPRARDGRVL